MPPCGHVEESSLRAFMRNVGLDSKRVKANLEAAGMQVDPTQPMKAIAEASGREVIDVVDLIGAADGAE